MDPHSGQSLANLPRVYPNLWILGERMTTCHPRVLFCLSKQMGIALHPTTSPYHHHIYVVFKYQYLLRSSIGLPLKIPKLDDGNIYSNSCPKHFARNEPVSDGFWSLSPVILSFGSMIIIKSLSPLYPLLNMIISYLSSLYPLIRSYPLIWSLIIINHQHAH